MDWQTPIAATCSTLQLVLALPTLEGQRGVKAALLGGWEISTIVQAASGQALTVYTGARAGV